MASILSEFSAQALSLNQLTLLWGKVPSGLPLLGSLALLVFSLTDT